MRSVALALLLLAAPAQAQDAPDWRRTKCERYTKDWTEALRRFGPAGLSPDFLNRHDAFLASGCDGPREVCPRSKEELALANAMVLRAMNAGTASTFLPFACRRS